VFLDVLLGTVREHYKITFDEFRYRAPIMAHMKEVRLSKRSDCAQEFITPKPNEMNSHHILLSCRERMLQKV
jgi:hypothetical protein